MCGLIQYFDGEDIAVETPLDEFSFWRRAEQAAISAESKKKAQYFQECYKEIEKGWSEL